MSNSDPNIIGLSYTASFNHRMPLNPAANDYAPKMQVSDPPSPYLEARVLNLEEEHSSLREEVLSLSEMYHDLCSSVDRLRKGGWRVTVGPFQEQDRTPSHLRAMDFKRQLEELTQEVHKSVDGVTDVEKVNETTTSKANGTVPPHLRTAGAKAESGSKPLPPHLRGKTMTRYVFASRAA